ncbi:MAG: Rho termination factor N-terminal domain-containing protein, partial [Moorella sp. (in: Bacteria)]|nr:Rho termination factor N-terminal domain-containing protein [Moorella sp. (in: firmicutes)]
MHTAELESKTMVELYRIARELNLSGYSRLRKKELVFEIAKALAQKEQREQEKEEQLQAQGILEILPDGYGFLRPFGYIPSGDDIYISPSQIRRFDLRTGDKVAGLVRPPKDNERFFALLRVEKVNGENPETSPERLHFDALTPIYPHERYTLETGNGDP